VEVVEDREEAASLFQVRSQGSSGEEAWRSKYWSESGPLRPCVPKEKKTDCPGHLALSRLSPCRPSAKKWSWKKWTKGGSLKTKLTEVDNRRQLRNKEERNGQIRAAENKAERIARWEATKKQSRKKWTD
jgi:hypothetical protein